jgi:hypothetical protein
MSKQLLTIVRGERIANKSSQGWPSYARLKGLMNYIAYGRYQDQPTFARAGLDAETDPTPAWLVPYRQRIRVNEPLDDGAVHCFLDDYRFETVWTRPYKALSALRLYTTLLSPDFSLYREWPLTLQLWNVYRNRWCGRFWQSQGFRVIPTVSWSTAASYDFCFLGVPKRGVVAVSAVGVKQRAEELQKQATSERLRADDFYVQVEDAQLAAAAVQGRLTGGQRRAEEMQQRAEAAQARAANAQARADEMQLALEAAQGRAAGEQARADEVQLELTQVQQEADELRRRVAELEAEAAAGRNFQVEMGPVGRAWQALNDETQTLALYNAHLLPVAEAAGRLGVHESTVRRRAKRLNGQPAEVA